MLGAYVFYGLRTGGYLFLPPIPFAPHTVDLGGPWATVPAILLAPRGLRPHRGAVRRTRPAPPARRLAAREAPRVSRAADHDPGDRRAAFRHQRAGRSGGAAQRPDDVRPRLRRRRALGPLHPRRDRAVAAALLWALYRFTRFGLATRAAAEDETKAMLAGLPPNELSLVEHRARLRAGRRVARRARRPDDATRPDHDPARGGPGARRRAARPLHLLRHRGRRRHSRWASSTRS